MDGLAGIEVEVKIYLGKQVHIAYLKTQLERLKDCNVPFPTLSLLSTVKISIICCLMFESTIELQLSFKVRQKNFRIIIET